MVLDLKLKKCNTIYTINDGLHKPYSIRKQIRNQDGFIPFSILFAFGTRRTHPLLIDPARLLRTTRPPPTTDTDPSDHPQAQHTS